MNDVVAIRSGRIVGGVSMLLAVAPVVVFVAVGQAGLMWEEWVVHTAVNGFLFGLLLMVVVPRQPRNGAVWAVGWSGLLFGLHKSAGALAVWWAQDRFGSDALGGFRSIPDLPTGLFLLAWLEQWLWWPALGLLLTFGLLLFPDGSLPSRRWSPVAWLAAVSIVGVAVGFAPIDSLLTDDSPTPVLIAIFLPLLGLVAFASLSSLAVRYRSADGQLRHQLRWITFGAAAVVVSSSSGSIDETLNQVAVLAALTILVGCYGIAVVKYRLYDIDVVISKSFTYLGLVTAITIVYVAVVVVPLLVLNDGGAADPGVALPIVATALVAVLFEPARRWLRRRTDRLVFGQRATPHEVLSDVTARLPRAGDASTEELARLLAAGTGAGEATVWLRIGDALYPDGTWPPDRSQEIAPVPVETLTGGDRLDLVPVRHGDEALGAISITKPDDQVNPADTSLLVDVADGAALTLRKIRLDAELEDQARQLRASRQRLVAAHDQERHRLERDLHDGAQQHVVALKIKLGLAKTLAYSVGAARIGDSIADLADHSQEAIEELRAIAHGIYPPLLEAEGLAPALASAAGRADLHVDLRVSDLDRLPRPVEETAYFCVLAILQQALRAGAGHVNIDVDANGAELILSATADAAEAELDSTDIADRVGAAEGRLNTSRDELTTRLHMTIPIKEVATS